MDRLQDIEDRYMSWEYDYNLTREDIDWLIEKVDRYEKVLKEITEHSKVSFQGKIAKEALDGLS